MADRDNFIYVTGGQGYLDSNVYVSMDIGISWVVAGAVYNFANGIVNEQYFESSTSCTAIQVVSGAGVYYKQLTIYGGTILLNTTATGTVIVEAVHSTYFNAQFRSLMPPPQVNFTWSASVTSIVPARTYPACAWDMHSAVNIPAMWYLNGETGTTTTALNSDGYVSYDGFTTSSVYLSMPISGANATILRRAGSAAYLANGNLLVFGGKTTGSVVLQSVIVSNNSGVSWYPAATTAAMWPARSDMASCVMPYTNTVVVMGGLLASGSSTNDVWISSDGQGAVWTQQPTTLTTTWASSPCVGLYPMSVGANSSLILTTNVATIYTSHNLGYSFSAVITAPWTTRNYITLVTDRDNIVYATGGQGIQDANVYVSFDVGNTWSTTSSTYNFANGLLNQQYFEASTSCSAIQIVTLNGIWYKQLTVYGGTILLNTSLTATTPVEAIHATLTSTATFSLLAATGASSTVIVTTVVSSSTFTTAASLSSSSPQIAVPTRNVNVTWSASESLIVPQKTYPACAWDLHSVVQHTANVVFIR